MTARKLLLLNLAWAVLAAGAYVIGKRDGAGPESTEARVEDTGNARSASVQRGGGESRTPDGAPGGRKDIPLEGANGLMQALREARAQEEEKLAEFARTVTPENALAMLKVFEETPRDEMTDRLFAEFLQAWGKVAGPAAMSVAMDSFGKARADSRWRVGCDGDTKNDLGMVSVMAGWASVDLAAAMDFATGLHDGGETWDSTRTHLGILRALENSDLDAAVAYAEEFYADTLEFWSRAPYSAYKEEPFRGLDRVLAAVEQQRGLAGLEFWIAGIDGEAPGLREYKLKATSKMLEAFREESPERAAQWVAANAERGFIEQYDIVSAAKVFADTPEGQVDWIAALPEGSDRSALYGPFRTFLREDFDAAGDWLAKQPLDPTYDLAIAHYAKESAPYDPRAARLWANEITEERLRSIMLKEIDEIEQTEVPQP